MSNSLCYSDCDCTCTECSQWWLRVLFPEEEQEEQEEQAPDDYYDWRDDGGDDDDDLWVPKTRQEAINYVVSNEHGAWMIDALMARR